MPQRTVQTGQDWGSVNVGRSTVARAKPKTNAALSSLARAGLISTEKRYGVKNSSAHSATTMSAPKLEETEETKHNRVDKSLSKAIHQARMAEKMTQKDLATAINAEVYLWTENQNDQCSHN